MREPYYAYIMSNRSRTLYTGISGSLRKRVYEHKRRLSPGFTSRYKVDILVYAEAFDDALSAIRREKQIKGMSRAKKIDLVTSMNPGLEDLSAGWFEDMPEP